MAAAREGEWGSVTHKATLVQLRANIDAVQAERDRSERLARQRDYRARYLPKQIEAARLKVAHLEIEAARLGVPV